MTIGSTLNLTFLPLWFRLILVCLFLIGSTLLYVAMWIGLFGAVFSLVRYIFSSGPIVVISLLRSLLARSAVKSERTANNSSEEQSSQKQKFEQRSSEQQSQKPPAKQASKEQDHYSILGVSAGASRQAIQTAYREQMKLYHPDRVEHLGDVLRRTAHEQAIKIQNAYQALI